AVDRHDLGAGVADGGHDQLAGQDQGFLVGQQQALAGAGRGQGRAQSGGTDDGRDHGVAVGPGGQRLQGLVAGMGAGIQAGLAQPVAQARVQGRVGDHRVCGAMRDAQLQQGIDPATGGEDGGAHALWMAGDDIERGGADGAGGSEDRDAADVGGGGHAGDPVQNPAISLPMANTGRAASTPSMRSSTPPWPGIRSPESFTPAWRLSRLSTRSPTMENRVATRATRATAGHCGTPDPASQPNARATTMPATTPPAAPSTVLLGLMVGASLRRPR